MPRDRFSAFQLESRLEHRPDGQSELRAWVASRLELAGGATHFGFVLGEVATLSFERGEFRLVPGMYFSLNGSGSVSGEGRGVVFSRLGYRGFFWIGGPVEETGRLRYIDGCSDSLLLPPVLLGDPCLNLLHLPAGTSQSTHTHPSLRAGLVIRGAGRCTSRDRQSALSVGDAFVIPPRLPHAFQTADRPLSVVAYHPDSDFGPTDDDHPMINRTLLDV